MLRILILALIAVVFTSARAHAENVLLYKDVDGRGDALRFEEGKVNDVGRGWHDVVSCIWIRYGYRIEGYPHINFQGGELLIEAPANGAAPVVSAGCKYERMDGGWQVNIHKSGWHDVISSYKVTKLR